MGASSGKISVIVWWTA